MNTILTILFLSGILKIFNTRFCYLTRLKLNFEIDESKIRYRQKYLKMTFDFTVWRSVIDSKRCHAYGDKAVKSLESNQLEIDEDWSVVFTNTMDISDKKDDLRKFHVKAMLDTLDDKSGRIFNTENGMIFGEYSNTHQTFKLASKFDEKFPNPSKNDQIKIMASNGEKKGENVWQSIYYCFSSETNQVPIVYRMSNDDWKQFTYFDEGTFYSSYETYKSPGLETYVIVFQELNASHEIKFGLDKLDDYVHVVRDYQIQGEAKTTSQISFPLDTILLPINEEIVCLDFAKEKVVKWNSDSTEESFCEIGLGVKASITAHKSKQRMWDVALSYTALSGDALIIQKISGYLKQPKKPIESIKQSQFEKPNFKPLNLAEKNTNNFGLDWYPETLGSRLVLRMTSTRPILRIQDFNVRLIKLNSQLDSSVDKNLLLNEISTFKELYAKYKFLFPANSLDQAKSLTLKYIPKPLEDFAENYANYNVLNSGLKEAFAELNFPDWPPAKTLEDQFESSSKNLGQNGPKKPPMTPSVCRRIFAELADYNVDSETYKNSFENLLKIQSKIATEDFSRLLETLVKKSPIKPLKDWSDDASIRELVPNFHSIKSKSLADNNDSSYFDDLIPFLKKVRDSIRLIPYLKGYTIEQYQEECLDSVSDMIEIPKNPYSNWYRINSATHALKNHSQRYGDLLSIYQNAKGDYSKLTSESIMAKAESEEKAFLKTAVESLKNFAQASRLLEATKIASLKTLRNHLESLLTETCKLFKAECAIYLQTIAKFTSSTAAELFDRSLRGLLKLSPEANQGSAQELADPVDWLWKQQYALEFRKNEDVYSKIADLVLGLESMIQNAQEISKGTKSIKGNFATVEKIEAGKSFEEQVKSRNFLRIKLSSNFYLQVKNVSKEQIPKYFLCHRSEDKSLITLEEVTTDSPVVLQEGSFGFCYFDSSSRFDWFDITHSLTHPLETLNKNSYSQYFRFEIQQKTFLI